MNQDTIIGIVGAVVLVGVMAGVFVYEYNNVPDTQRDDAALRAAFEASYPGMDPDGDLDGDGVHNFRDNDLDGDELPNAEDPDVIWTITLDGDISQGGPGSPLATDTFSAEAGLGMLSVEVTITPGPGGQLLNDYQTDLLDPDGASLDRKTGTTVTLSSAADDLAAGQYTVSFETGSAVVAATYEARVTLQYL